jgi:hypothetical protein
MIIYGITEEQLLKRKFDDSNRSPCKRRQISSRTEDAISINGDDDYSQSDETHYEDNDFYLDISDETSHQGESQAFRERGHLSGYVGDEPEHSTSQRSNFGEECDGNETIHTEDGGSCIHLNESYSDGDSAAGYPRSHGNDYPDEQSDSEITQTTTDSFSSGENEFSW